LEFEVGFFRQDHVGLSIGATHLAIASAAQRGESIDIRHCVVETLEEGVCRPSPVEKNILQIDRWKKAIRSVLDRFPRVRYLTLALPDSAVRMLLLDLQQVPKSRNDFEKLIQWHMEKTFLYPLGASRFSYQVLSRERGQTKILATAVKKEVIEQYESLDEGHPIEARRISPSSFYLFNLFRPHMTRAAGETGYFVFVCLIDQSLTVFIFEKGHVRFIRVKEVPQTGEDAGRAADFIIEELGNSLSFYDGGGSRLQNLTHLFLLLEKTSPEMEARFQEVFHIIPVFFNPSQVIRSAPSPLSESPEWTLRMLSAAAAAVGG
jgi:Tfp pilus assembly PilM family ATPase